MYNLLRPWIRLNYCDHKVAAVEHRRAAARQGRARAHRNVLPAVVEEGEARGFQTRQRNSELVCDNQETE